MIDARSLTGSRRRFLAMGVGVALATLAGCGDAEVGSAPAVGKSRKEIIGDGPLNDPASSKAPRKKR